MTTVYDFSARRIEGNEQSLADFRDQVLLVVNTASQCSQTPQYTGLQKLYKAYRRQGFSVLGFPCDQFGHQEPGDENEIANFCSTIYHVTFPMFAKIDVNGPGRHPLYEWLAARDTQPDAGGDEPLSGLHAHCERRALRAMGGGERRALTGVAT